ncbi:MAG: RluA family pseudouridine synthase [Clostridia bacterium]|nr:RluA family pseudouridine synthase [Clostridia bacterium]
MPVLTHTVSGAEAGRTVKSIALGEMRMSRSLFSRLKFSGGLTLDGNPVRADARLEAGQVLRAQWRDSQTLCLTPYAVSFEIPYRDERYWIVDKPAPLPTLCSARQEGPTLENALYARLGCPKDFVFRPVNRLDKGTSGLLAVAWDAHAQQLLQRQLHTDAFVREYLAVCQGHLPQAEGTVDLPIARGDGVRREVRPDGVRAVTHYRVENETEAYSLVRLRLETGRTHQIRVHMAGLGCPVAGDYVYGQADSRLPGRFALHACRLRFFNPFTGEHAEAESPLPEVLKALLYAL